MSGFLLDTNVISELIRRRPSASVTGWVEATDETLLYLSVLSLGEIRKGIVSLASASRRMALGAWLEGELAIRFSHRILSFDEGVADRWGRLAARAETAGRRLPVIDGLLAATALHHNLTLVTRNVSDVASTGVPVFNPWAS